MDYEATGNKTSENTGDAQNSGNNISETAQNKLDKEKVGEGKFLVLGILCTIIGIAFSLVGWQESSLLSILGGIVIIILGITIYSLGSLVPYIVSIEANMRLFKMKE